MEKKPSYYSPQIKKKNHSTAQTAEDIFCRLPRIMVNTCLEEYCVTSNCLHICLKPLYKNQQLKATKCQHCFYNSYISNCLLNSWFYGNFSLLVNVHVCVAGIQHQHTLFPTQFTFINFNYYFFLCL